jgi:hypothetical protein
MSERNLIQERTKRATGEGWEEVETTHSRRAADSWRRTAEKRVNDNLSEAAVCLAVKSPEPFSGKGFVD